MAWLQKRPIVSNPTSFVSVGLHKTLMIVGLGNPGKQYDQTRHNIGFECIDTFIETFEEMSKPVVKKDLKSLVSTGTIGSTRVIAIKPTTFMNDSGQAVERAASFFKLSPMAIAVVHDDLDIEFGQIRTRFGGSSTHNGIRSINSHLSDENYGRIRIGIHNKLADKMDSADFVLDKFSAQESKQLKNLRKEAVAILSEYIFSAGQLPSDTRNFIV